VVYCISICPQCKEEYVSETGQNLGTGLSEHFNKTNPKSAVQIYTSQTGHVIPMKSCKINGQEENWRSQRKTLQTLKTSFTDKPQSQARQGGPPNFYQTSASDREFYPSRDFMQLQGAQESSHFVTAIQCKKKHLSRFYP
jgi:hypothetical protein